MIEQVVLYIISFSIFSVLQSLAINGIYESFRGGCVDDLNKGRLCDGNIFYKINPFFFEKYKNKNWSKPLWSCPRCMASFHGGLTFWGTVLPIFGFHLLEIWIFIFDVFVLVSLNWWVYKKL